MSAHIIINNTLNRPLVFPLRKAGGKLEFKPGKQKVKAELWGSAKVGVCKGAVGRRELVEDAAGSTPEDEITAVRFIDGLVSGRYKDPSAAKDAKLNTLLDKLAAAVAGPDRGLLAALEARLAALEGGEANATDTAADTAADAPAPAGPSAAKVADMTVVDLRAAIKAGTVSAEVALEAHAIEAAKDRPRETVLDILERATEG